MLTIKVMMVSGVLVGYTVSDRWNLLALTGKFTITPDDLKALRTMLKDEGFKINTIKRVKPIWAASPLERAALGEVAPIYIRQAVA